MADTSTSTSLIPNLNTDSPYGSNIIPASNLQGATPIQLPPPATTPDYNGIIGSTQKTLQSNLDTATTARDAITNVNNNPQDPNSVSGQIISLMGSENNKAADTNTAMDASGATALAKQLADLNTEAQNLGLETSKTNLSLESGASGKDVTTQFLGKQEQEVNRQSAIKALGIAQRANIAQGNYTIAKDNAQKMIDLKYAPIENQIATLKQQYDFNKDALTAADAKRTEALNAFIKKQDQDLADKKAIDTQIQNIKIDAGKFGASADVIKAIDSAKTVGEALIAAKGYLTDPIEKAYKIAQTNSLNAKTGTTINGAGGQYNQDSYQAFNAISDSDANKSQAQFGGLSKNGLLQAANLYLAEGGKMPSLGLGSNANTQAKRDSIINIGGAIADQLGLTLPQISAMYKANSTSATQIVNRVAKIDAVSGALTNQFPRLAELADKVGKLGIQESDITAGKTKAMQKFGSVDAANYIELIQTIRSDYAALQSSIGGGRGGEFFAKNAQEAIPLGLTADQYRGLQQTIQLSAINAQKGTTDEANKLIGNIGSPTLYGGVTLPPSASSGGSNYTSGNQSFNLPN